MDESPDQQKLEAIQLNPQVEKDESQTEDLIIPTRSITHSSTAFFVGGIMGNYTDLESPTTVLGSLVFTRYTDEDRAWDYGLELLGSNYYGVSAGRKWILSAYKYNEPYLKMAAGSYWRPIEGLGSLVNIYRYQMRFAAGFEDLFSSKRHMRTELNLAWSLSGFSLSLALGFAF